ncbi:hypothetical protein KP509_23G080300 [Ceratopteris richardii]|uniref:SOSEKI DIX-like domain-containing protein n=1 Tax=Ceratopteris richardii TaxID=49495 RepID=A0A8T2S3L7_CERRI|nr:hypothetical protein KP509_23G080300 [Ceratopteris richardii]KAH7302628.1 hypothetical protein KP509_23G080300 [Ceratopteris richardii]KAH7302629.1 hypothetical protein KP509_23G080300 [Ceratopteris richardii]KAH7302630.1 hypothetical protein KP509_23G080300 [Ceratopteris richardii]KAH7302631.1 hypothetical protein KP509_23G080300 [Ceratopteris richardii]
MEPKLPLQPKTLRRRVHVVYYLSRGGQMDHPHLLEGYLSSAQEGLLLRDFKRWLAILRGKSMPNSFSWSYKRAYKNGFVWHDLGENDLIRPLAKNEYVLMGSEIKEQPLHVEKCNCGVNPQQTDTKMDSTKTGSDNQGETVNKPVTRSPKLITERSSNDREDNKTEKVLPSLDSPARLELITTENKFQRIGSRTLHKSFDLYRSGGPSKDPNDFTDKRLPDELKNSSNIHDTKQFTTTQSSENMGHIPSPGKISVRDSKITLRNSQREYLEDGDQMGELHGRDRKKNIKHIRDTSSSTHLKHTISIAHAKADRVKDSIKEKKYGQKLSDSCINDESTSSFIVDASTQTGDSTRCSMEEQQECIDSECYDRPVGDLANSSYHSSDFSPYDSTILNSVRRISSARFNSNHDQDQSHRGNLSLHLSQEFPNLPAIQRSIKAEQSSEIEEIPIGNSNTSLSHQISQNHLGSPGTVSSCSAVSARSSTRFARQETNGIPITVMPTKPTKKTTARTENHRRHSKGGSSQHSTNAAMESSSSGPHSLLKQILTCGNADVVSEKKPHNSISSHNFVVINHNALSGLPGTTPSRAINAATRTYDDLDKSRNAICGVCQRGVPIKKVTRTASSDTKAVISATASEQGSTRDDTISSPESAFSSGYRHHIKSNMMKAHSLSSSFAAAALRSASSRSHRSNLTAADENDDDGSKLSASRRFRVHHPASATAANSGTPYGNMSPGLLSIASSTPRRCALQSDIT